MSHRGKYGDSKNEGLASVKRPPNIQASKQNTTSAASSSMFPPINHTSQAFIQYGTDSQSLTGGRKVKSYASAVTSRHVELLTPLSTDISSAVQRGRAPAGANSKHGTGLDIKGLGGSAVSGAYNAPTAAPTIPSPVATRKHSRQPRAVVNGSMSESALLARIQVGEVGQVHQVKHAPKAGEAGGKVAGTVRQASIGKLMQGDANSLAASDHGAPLSDFSSYQTDRRKLVELVQESLTSAVAVQSSPFLKTAAANGEEVLATVAQEKLSSVAQFHDERRRSLAAQESQGQEAGLKELIAKRYVKASADATGGQNLLDFASDTMPPPLALPVVTATSLEHLASAPKLSARDNVVTILNSARRSINATTMDPNLTMKEEKMKDGTVIALNETRNAVPVKLNEHHRKAAVDNADEGEKHGIPLKPRRKSKDNKDSKDVKDSKEHQLQHFADANGTQHHKGALLALPSLHSHGATDGQAAMHSHLPHGTPSAPTLPPTLSGKGSTSGAARIASAATSRVLRPAKYDQLVQTPAHSEELRSFLTSAELSEVRDFPGTLYYLGQKSAKLQPRMLPIAPAVPVGGSSNGSKPLGLYDDDSGTYIATNKGDHIAYRYAIKHELGAGSFGSVLCCHDFKHDVDVAVKVIKSQHKFTVQAQSELKILSLLNKDEAAREKAHCIKLLGSFTFRSHVCFSFPLYGLNLYDFLKSNNFKGVNYKFVKRLAYQLFEHLDYLRSKGIVHLDLKPENILLQDEATVKIVVIDFGSSCFNGVTPFSYVQSRFYRSPEVLLGCPYGPEVDIWSAACILPEMRSSLPIFPGRDEVDQFGCIVECLGLPPAEMVDKGGRRSRFFDAQNRLLKGKQKGQSHASAGHVVEVSSRVPASRSIASLAKTKNSADDIHMLSLLGACLRWDPADRLTPQQALQHPWFQSSNHAHS